MASKVFEESVTATAAFTATALGKAAPGASPWSSISAGEGTGAPPLVENLLAEETLGS